MNTHRESSTITNAACVTLQVSSTCITAQRRVRDERSRRTQILPRHPSPPGQGTENHPHQPVRLQSNDPRTIRNGKQQTGKYTSLQRRLTHQGDGDGHSDGSTGVSKPGRKSDVRHACYPTPPGANNSADLTIPTKAPKDTRKSSKAGTS